MASRFGSRRQRLWLSAALAFLALIAILAIAAPVSKTLEPPTTESVVFLASDGTPFVRRGPRIEAPVRIERLPAHVWQAFLAVEDRRFYNHAGIDPIGIGRAMWRNLSALELREGGSTVTQQLARRAYLGSDRTFARKLKETVLALWIEARLSKDQILERYLSTAYFGENVYGLRAAAKYYFSREPEELGVEQAALLAGLIKAPSRLSPIDNLEGARGRARLVLGSMVKVGVLDEKEARQLPEARLDLDNELPSGSYFADWVLANSSPAGDEAGPRIIATTLDRRLQRLAARAASRAPRRAQVALVAMRPDGRVVAMVGGRSYRESAYNRATQARRQPGSAFKLFVYLTALKQGLTPNHWVIDAPVRVDGWSPENADRRYRGVMTLREAFARSSNVAAVQVAETVGRDKVIETARELGISGELKPNASLALGTSGTSLLEMTAAFAGVAANQFPVAPRGVAETRDNWLHKVAGGQRSFEDERIRLMMADLLWSATNLGTGRSAALRTPTFGKTGTSQDNRDALFIGFAGDLVTGVWIGHDDNRPLGNIAGGGAPAQVWRDFMAAALNDRPARTHWNALSMTDDRPSTREHRRGGGRWKRGWRHGRDD